MSGAEVLLVVGIIANVEAVVDGSLKIVSRIASFCRDASELPRVLQEVQNHLPLLMVALKKRSDETVLSRLDLYEREVLLKALMLLKSKAENLQSILNEICPPDDASKWRKGWKAISSLRQDKKIQEIMNGMRDDMQFLAFNDFQPPRRLSVAVEAGLETTPAKILKPLFMVDIWRADEYIGRTDVMERLKTMLSIEGQHNRVALAAMGGMGKTRIALEYALQYRNSEQISVFWIHASTAVRVTDGFGRIARSANVAGFDDPQNGGVKSVKRWLESEESGRWLMIVDNADDGDMFYGSERFGDIFPHSDNGSIIMTTRDKRVGLNFTGSLSKIILLEALNESHSMELLASKFGTEVDVESSQELVKELEGIPLALVQAAAFIQGNSIEINEYLDMYRESPNSQIELLSEDFEDVIRDPESRNPIAATWAISFDHIEQNSPLAAQILKKMCILDFQGIPVSLLKAEERPTEFLKAVGTLQAFCLIMVGNTDTGTGNPTEKSYNLHRLVRIAMRNWLKIHNHLHIWTAKTLKATASKFPDLLEASWTSMDKWMAYLPHAVALLLSDELKMVDDHAIPVVFFEQKMIGGHASDDSICGVCAATLMINISFALDNQSRYVDSRFWALRQLSLRRYLLGEHNPDTIESMIRATESHYRCGDLAQAQKLGEYAIKIIETTGQPPNLVATGLEVQGIILAEHGQWTEAERCHSESLKLRQEFFKPEHPRIARSMENLSFIYRNLGREDDAEKILHDALNIRIKVSGPQSPDALVDMAILSNLYHSVGRYEEALELNIQASTLQASVLGRKHPETIKTLSNTAQVYYGRGGFAEGIALGLKTLELSKEVLGPEDSWTLSILLGLCVPYAKQGNRKESIRLLLQAHEGIERRAKAVGLQDPETSNLMGNLANTYEQQGRYKKAEQLRIDLLTSRIETFGEDSPAALSSMTMLAMNYHNQNLYEQAARYQNDALQQQTRLLGPEDSGTIFRMVAVAVEWCYMNHLLDSERLNREAVAIARRALQPGDPTYKYALSNLAGIYNSLRKYEKAENLFREILQFEEANELLSDQDFKVLEIAQTKTDLATVLRNQVRFREAKEMANAAEDFLVKRGRMKKLRRKDDEIVKEGIENPSNRMPISMKSLPNNIRMIMAAANMDLGELSNAQSLYFDMLEDEVRKWRPEDATLSETLAVLSGLEKLAEIYARCKKYAKAENILSHILEARTKIRGRKHLESLNTMCALAAVYNYMEQYEKALELYRQSKELYLGHSIDTANSKIKVADIDCGIARSYIKLGRVEDAKNVIIAACEVFKEFAAENESYTLSSKAILAMTYREIGEEKLMEAVGIGEQLVQTWTETVGTRHPETVNAMESLVATYRKQGRDTEANNLSAEAEAIYKELDFGFGVEEERKVNELIQKVLREWEKHEEVILECLEGVSTA